MSISGINKKQVQRHFRKTVLVYFILSLAAIAVNLIYGLFGHGVHAASMTWMFLYPLLGGALLFLLLGIFFPSLRNAAGYRLFFNAYSSGIATLTVGGLLNGILEIAGTSSPYTIAFYAFGGACILLAVLALLRERF